MPEQSTKPRVAHLINVYLDLSDTFIYQYLSNLRCFDPVVVVERTENLDRFPLDAPIHTLDGIWRRGSWSWFRGRFDCYFCRRDPLEALAARILAKEASQLIHAHFGPQGYWALGLKQQFQVPLITTFYGMDMSELPREQRWRDAYQTLFSEGDAFLVEGPHMRESLIQLGCPPEKAHIQHIGIDVKQIEFIPRTAPEDGPIRLLLCGRFTEKKGIEYAIRAAAILKRQRMDFELRIIGDGELRPQIEQLIDDLDVSAHVRLLGYRSHTEFVRELREAHVFVAPSVTAANGDSEGGAPTVLLEAQAAGIPVVASRHADIPEVIRDGKSGFLVPERDVAALAEQLLQVLQQPDEWIEIGLAGRRHMEENHSIYLETRKLEEIYSQVCGA